MPFRVPGTMTCLVKSDPDLNVSKFWAIGFVPSPSGMPALRRWWGRIGTKGQTDVLGPFTADELCLSKARSLVEAKLKEGYQRTEVLNFEPPFPVERAESRLSVQGYNADGWPVVSCRMTRF
jgi:predicted DNA-binding WGR domain protein